MEKYNSNKFWENINKDIVNENKLENLLENFRSSSVNYKISIFNPETNGVRYLKTLMYNLASALTNDEFEKIKRIKNRNFGQPFSIQYNGEEIDLDYIQSVDEISFIEKSIDLNKKNILEIGAGYGRTVHTILSNYSVSSYTIIDLPDTMTISKKYLRKVLSKENFGKIIFIPVNELSNRILDKYDLAINIDSFAEMDEEVVFNYLALINQKVDNFYTKNPVGKYLDKTLDNHTQGSEIVEQALENGILKTILNIDSNIDVENNVPNFIDAYSPTKEWKTISDSWAKPFSHYWQVLYSKNKL